MPKRSEEHMAERRRQILEAALRCYRKRGFHRTSINDIGRAAKLSVGAVYTHFKSKRAITLALADLSVAWSQGLNFDGVQEVRQFLIDGIRHLDTAEGAEGARVDFQIYQLGLHDRKLGQRSRVALHALEHLLMSTLESLQSRGEISEEYDVENGARLLASVVNAVWLSRAIDPEHSAAAYQACITSEFERMKTPAVAKPARRLPGSGRSVARKV